MGLLDALKMEEHGPGYSRPIILIMTTIQESKKALKELREQLKKDPEAVQKLLKKAGILTPTGKLSKRYK